MENKKLQGATVIKCCHGCVPPKRHTACWGHCPEYLAERVEYDRKREIENKRRSLDAAIYGDRMEKVYKAMRERERARKVKR